MAIDRELLREALRELVRLRSKTVTQTGLVSRLYSAALDDWAGSLGVEARKLNKLVLVKEVLPIRRGY